MAADLESIEVNVVPSVQAVADAVTNVRSEDLSDVFNEVASERSKLDSTDSFRFAEYKFEPLTIFLSYGHDKYQHYGIRVKRDLERRGHKVWFDLDQLLTGGDWEDDITNGLELVKKAGSRGRMVLLLTPHAVRRPNGYCINEAARAVENKVPIIPVMVVSCSPPLTIRGFKFLDVRDCIPEGSAADGDGDSEPWRAILDGDTYRRKFRMLVSCVELNALLPAICGSALGSCASTDLTPEALARSNGSAAATAASAAAGGGSGEFKVGEQQEKPKPRLFISCDPSVTVLALRLQLDLQAQGYPVMFDADRFASPAAGVREAYIEEAMAWATCKDLKKQQAEAEGGGSGAPAAIPDGKVLLLMTPEAVRRPNGFCLNEFMAALGSGLDFIPLMVRWSVPPVSICRIQWLSLMDCLVPATPATSTAAAAAAAAGDGDGSSSSQSCVAIAEPHYQASVAKLLAAMTAGLDHQGVQARLIAQLNPLHFNSSSGGRAAFAGRQWLTALFTQWVKDPAAAAAAAGAAAAAAAATAAESKDGEAVAAAAASAWQRRVVWITGTIGVGKTRFATWLSSNNPSVAAFHIAVRGDAATCDPRRAILSICYQLSTQIDAYRQHLSDLPLEEIVPVGSMEMLFSQLLAAPLKGIACPATGPVVIVVDAVEAMNDGAFMANQIATTFYKQIKRLPDWIRVLLLSRDQDPTLTHCLRGLPAVELRPDLPENQSDLREFLASELRAFSQDPSQPVPAASLNEICRRAEGLFLYADHILGELRDARLRLNSVQDFPVGLGGVFEKIFDHQFAGKMSVWETLCRPVLEVSVAATEPLEWERVRDIACIDSYQAKDVLLAFGSLFSVVKGFLKPFHSSMMEWLTDPSRAATYLVDTRSGHKRIGRWCWDQFNVITQKDRLADLLPKYAIRSSVEHLTSSGDAALLGHARLLQSDDSFQLARRLLAIKEDGMFGYFHGPLARGDTSRLLHGKPVGAFLIRYSANARSYCVSFINAAHQQAHNLLYKLPDGYSVVPPAAFRRDVHPLYADLGDFVEDYQKKKMLKVAIPVAKKQ